MEVDPDGTTCISHDRGWASRLQCMLNQLRKAKVFANKTDIFCKNASKAICTCTNRSNREPDARWDAITEEQFKEAETYFEKFIENLFNASSEHHALLEFNYRKMRQEDLLQNSSSARRFLYLFQRGHNDKTFDLLSKPTRQRATVEDEKRQRQTVHLKSLKPDQISLFMGRSGHNMKRYLRGKKKVKVEMKTEGEEVKAIITCRSQDRDSIRQRLEREADMLAERRRIHERNVAEYHGNLDNNEEEDME